MTAIAIELALEHLKVGADQAGPVEVKLRRAESHIADKVGPLAEKVVVERVSGSGPFILSTTPVVDIVSFTYLGGAAVDVDELYLDDGILSRSDERPFNGGTCVVTYRAGWATEDEPLPGGLETAVLELLRHLWRETERGSGRRAGTSADTGTVPGFLLPYAVQSAIEPYLPVDGFA